MHGSMNIKSVRLVSGKRGIVPELLLVKDSGDTWVQMFSAELIVDKCGMYF